MTRHWGKPYAGFPQTPFPRRRAHVGWVIALGVSPTAQGKGLGKLLGERVLDQFQRLGVSRVQTIVEPETAELEPFFKTLGFKESPARVLVRQG